MTAIENYIPQRKPMVMVDTLVFASDEKAVTRFHVREDNLFLTDEGYFNESGLIENIAQTAAAMVGYQCMRKEIPVPIGYIAAIKNWQLNSTPLVNSTIQTQVEVTNQVMDFTLVEGRVEQDGKLLCRCEMRILLAKS